jgi:outer membrane biosynthesis protein TonB
MAVKCKNCGGAHPTWDCTKPKIEKAVAAKPAAKAAKPAPTKAITKRVVETKKVKPKLADQPKVVRKAVAARAVRKAKVAVPAAPAPKKRGRPATGSTFDKIAWQREYMRDYRKGIRRKEPTA